MQDASNEMINRELAGKFEKSGGMDASQHRARL